MPCRRDPYYALGLCPRFGLWPKTFGLSPNRGQSPKLFLSTLRQGGALPHIRRQSRVIECHFTSPRTRRSLASHQAAEPPSLNANLLYSPRTRRSLASHRAAEPLSLNATLLIRTRRSLVSHQAAEPLSLNATLLTAYKA